MNIIKRNRKKLVFVGALVCSLTLLEACKLKSKDKVSNTTHQKESSNSYKELLIGSWLDTSKSELHFTLFKDGSARSDNMATLLYKKWRLNGATLILTEESIGNGSSSIGEYSYEIQTLNAQEMILKQGNYLLKYTRK
ncbi:Lipocalin-like protein [Tenacibaculum sp. 190524A02b]|uniref:lipocalin family protein n=1 Tax=Tenacibaculum vairaonense TaxID=3137860 RepID=UPI0032B2AA90